MNKPMKLLSMKDILEAEFEDIEPKPLKPNPNEDPILRAEIEEAKRNGTS